MRKTVLSSVVALAFLAIGMTFGHAGNVRLADTEGSGFDVRISRQNLVVMVDTGHTARPLLVPISPFPLSESIAD